MDPIILELIFQTCKIAYVVADRSLQVIQAGGSTDFFFAGRQDIVERSLPDLIPELVGSESVLSDVLSGDLATYYLEHINRPALNGGTNYLTLTVLPYQDGRPNEGLLIVLIDTTQQGQAAQLLTQQRNELALLRRDLATANSQLDFLLRHYVPSQVADALLERRVLPQLGGELREVSVLFADLRGYTAIAEQLSPGQTMELVNHYLSIAADAIARAGGTVTQFMGDAVMALFNAPDDQPDHAQRAVHAGLDIQHQVGTESEQRLKNAGDADDLPSLYFGVGIHTGLVLVGNTGARWRYDYSAIGDTTNVAFRICSAARRQETLVSANTFVQVREHVIATALAPMQLEGKNAPIEILRIDAFRKEMSAREMTR
ncbi:MAG: adenylate/guanylate cyclase domain-containing protein [Anaerolineae bacterium]|nr:adenylate/guanylate cyclase domain-containing protein [Anaerolineae bacterium]